MNRFEVEMEYVEETWGTILHYDEVAFFLKSIRKSMIEGHNHSALEKVSQQLKEWGEEV